MWLFILLILSGAWLQTVIKLSIQSRAFRWATLLLFCLPMLFLYEQAAAINLKDFNTLMSSRETLNTICVLVIIQEALVLIFGTIVLRRYYLGRKLHFWYYAVLLPSGLFPVLCFAGMVYLFNTSSGANFLWVALRFIPIMLVITGGIAEILVLFKREQLIKVAALTSMVQMFTAMFLPVVFNGKISNCNFININISTIWSLLFLIAATALFTLISLLGMWQKLYGYSKKIIGFN